MNIYVGNIAPSTTEEELRKSFEEFGEVASLKMIKDRDSGEPRGFAFVEMNSDDNAQKAIAGMNGKDIGGQELRVNEAHKK